jgi:uncharacterized delta-60 repeat protein
MLKNSLLLFALTAISGLVSAQPGSLLPTIPRVQAGTALIDFGSTSDFAFASAIQRDGKLVLAGRCPGNDDDDFCVVRLDARLFLDSGFASGGKRIEPIVPSSNDSANSVAIAQDGRIVVAGTCQIDPENNPTRNGVCLMRLTPDGALDPTLIGPSGLASGKFAIALGSVSDSASGVAVQPDGKIVVVGTCIDDTVAETVFCAARFTESGALDASFVGPNATTANGKFLFAISPAVG